MPRNDAIERVLAAEATGDLWSRDALGFPVWSLERFRRYRSEALRGDPEAASISTQPSGRKRLAAELRSLRGSLADLRRGSPPERGRDIWVLSSSSYRRRTPEGEVPCIFAAHLERQLGERLLYVEFDTARLGSLSRDDVCSIDAIQSPLLAASRAAAPLLSRRLDRSLTDAFRPTSRRRLADRALYGRALLEVGRRWIARRPPKAVFVLCGYNMHAPLQQAARERGIPVIELQHGIIHESHPGYVLPELPGRLLPVPDHLVLFGAYFGRMLEREAPMWRDRWTVGGHPWLQAKRQETPTPTPDGERTVVFFGQYELPVRRRMRDAARHLRAELGDSWRVVIKPHPREPDSAEFFADAVAEGVELAPPGADSYSMLGACEVAVSEYSTLAIEALAFSCRSVALRSDSWTQSIRDAVTQGLIEPADTPADLARVVQSDAASTDRREVARDLFGVGEAEPDFEALIAHCRASMRT